MPSNHNHKSTEIYHKAISYPPQIQNNKPIHYPHKPIEANYPTQIWLKKKDSASLGAIPLRSENETHHQTPIYEWIPPPNSDLCHHRNPPPNSNLSHWNTHQTSIQPLKPTTKLQSSHQPLPIQPSNNHGTHYRSTQTLICAITKTPPQMPITTNPHPPPRRSINSDLHHSDP